MSLQIRDFNLGAYAIPEDVRGGVCLDIGANCTSTWKLKSKK